jgi:hypothetical protein
MLQDIPPHFIALVHNKTKQVVKGADNQSKGKS